MTTKDGIKSVQDLIQLNFDLAKLCEEVAAHLDQSVISERVKKFGIDHRLHAEILGGALKPILDKPIVTSLDMKGMILQNLGTVASLVGIQAALLMLKASERFVIKRYEEVMACPLPENVRYILRDQLRDNNKHFDYINEVLLREPVKEAS
jgi:hypothetical protein